MVNEVNDSFLASIGRFINPIFIPLGFANWQSAVSLLTGLMAKEVVLAINGSYLWWKFITILPIILQLLSAYGFLVFVLFYTPCVSVIGTMKKEYGTKLTLFSVFFN